MAGSVYVNWTDTNHSTMKSKLGTKKMVYQEPEQNIIEKINSSNMTLE